MDYFTNAKTRDRAIKAMSVAAEFSPRGRAAVFEDARGHAF